MQQNESHHSKKIPGVVWTVVYFLPWSVYWIVSPISALLGTLLPLAISSVLVVIQIKNHEKNPINIASFIYFCITTVGLIVFNTDIFIRKSGVLGFFALFLMALISLIVKTPYTLAISKKDYPELYWKDESFIAINNMLTGVWVAIFLVSSILLLIHPSHTVLLLNSIIISGTIISFALPPKLPAYLAKKKSRKYDWKINLNIQRMRGKDEYDVIVVGSGIGGLTCASILSKEGYKTLVMEQHYVVGGYCSSFYRMGFTFNVGVENISGVDDGAMKYILSELNLKPEELFVRNSMRFIFNQKQIDVNGSDDFKNALLKIFPEEAQSIHAFFDDAGKAHEECYQEAKRYGVPLPPDLIAKVSGSKALLNYPKEHPHFYDWTKKTYKEKLDEYFKSKDIKEFLCALLGYLGTQPEETLASNALTAVVSYYTKGGYFPLGGAQRLADTLKEVIKANGGKVLTRHIVNRILVESGRVKGVESKGNKYFSPIVVANANAKTTFLKLVGKEHLEENFVSYIENLPMSPSVFMVFLGIEGELTEYPNIIEDIDNGLSIVINSNADPLLAPKGKASITILTGANYHSFPERGTKEYMEKKRTTTNLLIEKAERLIPNLKSRIVFQDAATPKTFEAFTSMPEGAIYSFDQSISVKRPYFKTPIKGLYLASASTFPGGGIEAVAISGTICAKEISNTW